MSDLNTIGTSQAATSLNEPFEPAREDTFPTASQASFHDLFSRVTTDANSQPNADSLDTKSTAPIENLPKNTEEAEQPNPRLNDLDELMGSGAENTTGSLMDEIATTNHSKNHSSSQDVSETSGKPNNSVSLANDKHTPLSAGFAHPKSVIQVPSNPNEVQNGPSEAGNSTRNPTLAVISEEQAGIKHAHNTPDLLNRRETRTTVLKNGQANPSEPVRHTPKPQPHNLPVQAKTIFEPAEAPLRNTDETVPRPSNAITRTEHMFRKTALPADLINSGTKPADQLASILPDVTYQKTIKTNARTPLASGNLIPESGINPSRLDRKIALATHAAPNSPATDQRNIPSANGGGDLEPFGAPTGRKQDQTPTQVLPLENLARQRKLIHPAQTGMPVEEMVNLGNGPMPEGPKTQFGSEALNKLRREQPQNYGTRDTHSPSEKSTLLTTQATEYQKPLPTSDTPPHAGREIDLEQRLASDSQKRFVVPQKHPGIVHDNSFQVVSNAVNQPGMTALGSATRAHSPEPVLQRLPTQNQFETLLARSGPLGDGTRHTSPAEKGADNLRNPIALESVQFAIRTTSRDQQNPAEPVVLHQATFADIGARRIDACTTDKSVQLGTDQKNSAHTKTLASPDPIRIHSGARPDEVEVAFEMTKPSRTAANHLATATEQSFQAERPEIVKLSNLKTQFSASSLATTGLFGLSTEISNVTAIEQLTGIEPASSVLSLQSRAVHPSAVIGAVSGPYPLPLAQVVEALPSRAGQHVEIILRPEELGQVRMTLSATEGGMVLSVVSDRPDTLDLMRRNIADLGAELKQMGYENVDFNFSQSNGDKQFKQNQPDTDKNAAVLSEEIGNPPSSRTVLTGIDMRV